MTTKISLRECPFCARGVDDLSIAKNENGVYVVCLCDAQGPSFPNDAETGMSAEAIGGAIAAWNERGLDLVKAH